jgi:hypothetical protein
MSDNEAAQKEEKVHRQPCVGRRVSEFPWIKSVVRQNGEGRDTTKTI